MSKSRKIYIFGAQDSTADRANQDLKNDTDLDGLDVPTFNCDREDEGTRYFNVGHVVGGSDGDGHARSDYDNTIRLSRATPRGGNADSAKYMIEAKEPSARISRQLGSTKLLGDQKI